MLRHTVVFAALAILSFSQLSAQPFWARTVAGIGSNEALSVTGDEAGNIFSTGYFTTDAAVHGEALTSFGLTDIFIARQRRASIRTSNNPHIRTFSNQHI